MSAHTTLDFYATPPSLDAIASTGPFGVFTAKLTSSSLASSPFVVTYPVPADTSLPRLLYGTYPYPAFVGGQAVMGVVLANGGPELHISEVDAEIPGGYDLVKNGGHGTPLFRKDAPLSDATGAVDGAWEILDERHLRWTGSRTVAANAVSYWAAMVPFNESSDATSDVEPLAQSDGPQARVEFSNHVVATSREWGPSPGIIRLSVNPDTLSTDGYPWAGSGVRNPMQTRVEAFPGIMVRNDSKTYTVVPADQDVLAFQRATQNATFEVVNRTVNLGQDIRLHGDMQSLVSTLKQQGINSGTLTVDVYAPPSLGCHPTARVTKELGALPRAKIEDAWTWDGDGLPSALVAADDGNAYRVSSAGVLLGSATFHGVPLRLQPAVAAEPRVFVVDAAGIVTAKDALLTQTLWEAPLGTESVPDTPVADAAPVMTFDPAHQRVWVGSGTSAGTIVAFSWSGTRLFSDTLGSPILQVRCDAAGVCYALTTSALWRIDADAPRVDLVPLTAGKGFALGANHLLVLDGADVDDYSLDLAYGTTEPVFSRASPILATMGDATGDLVDDLVIAYADRSVAAVSGASATLSWLASPSEAPVPGADKCEMYEQETSGLDLGAGREDFYTADVCPRSAPDRRTPGLAVVASGGRTVFVEATGSIVYLDGFDAAGTHDAATVLDGDVGTVVARDGAWGWGASLVVGRDDGVFEVRRLDLAAQAPFSHAVTEFAGIFDVSIHVPDGAFFGSHIAIATLSWTDAQTGTQSAQLVDWFEVLDVDGNPVTHPSYRLIVVARDPSQPMTTGGG